MPSSPAYCPAPVAMDLGDELYDVVEPATFPRAQLRFRNQRWAEEIGLGDLDDAAWADHFARFQPLPENLPRPLALRYHGHQFGVYNPALGDGRGFLFAQLRHRATSRLLDLGTKGSGKTPWSRGGDGRLTLKGGIREVLATEMLEALGVTTSKSLSLFETGEALFRGDEPSPTRSSVLVRLSHSHIRIGSFQRLAYIDAVAGLRTLLEHAVEHHFGEIASASDLPAAFLREVVKRTAELAASYHVAGFVHGVLNTDNMNVTGESFDYGPYRFLPRFDPDLVAAYFDHTGLYAFGRQPAAFTFGLSRLAEALRPLAPASPLAYGVESFNRQYREAVARRLVRRLGLRPIGPDEDALLADSVFAFLEKSPVSFDRFFFDWCGGPASERRALEGPDAPQYSAAPFRALRSLLELYEPTCAARLDAPYYQRGAPVTLIYDVIESVWRAIDRMDDWSSFERLVDDIRSLGAAGCTGDDRASTAA